jgi:ArsR family transcriptional regulator, cadmium/lead-responsive transcriptional repressor
VTEQAVSAVPVPDGRAAVPASPAALPLLPATADGVELVAKFFRALGDPARLRLLEFLLPAEHTVSECVRHIGLSQGRVSVHLACLADCGYVQVRRAGRFAWYKIADPRVASLVTLARSLAADNAAALAECVRIPPDPAAEATPRP